jgi:transposase
MAKLLVSDELWAVAEPLLPPTRPPGTRGHPPVPNRVALAGIVFVLKTGIPWEYFPQELGCSGMTLWRRLRDWQRAGAWEALHRELLQRLADAGQIDWSRASADASRVPAKGGAPGPARIRSTAASRARTTTCSPTGAARRWSSSRPRRTSTRAPCWRAWSTPSRP